MDILGWETLDRAALAAALVERQFKFWWTDKQMASALGISRVYWNLVKNRHAQPGHKVAAAAYARWPELFP